MWRGSCLKGSFYGFIMFLASVTLNTTFLGILESIIPGTISLLWKVLICASPGDAVISQLSRSARMDGLSSAHTGTAN